MPTILENNLPFKIYTAVNMGSNEGMVYLGQVSNATNTSTTINVIPENYYSGCFSTFSFASVVPGPCARLDIATESDPSILIDLKWFDFRPSTDSSGEQELWPKNNALKSIVYADDGDFTATMNSLSTDGTVVINGAESGFIWSDEGIVGNENYCTFVLQSWKYKCENIAEPGPYFGMMGTPGQSNVMFLFRSVVGGQNIYVKDFGTYLQVFYTKIPRASRPGEIGQQYCSQLPPPNITCEPFIPANLGSFI